MFQNLRRMLSPAKTLKIQCEPCGHLATWTYNEAVARCGLDATPTDIRRRCRCQGCGREGHARVWI